jgi:O-antigen/teichoic acid export membrane protein
MSFLKESLRTFASRILLVLINFPISILIARFLGPTGQSVYSSATTYATNIVVIGLLGIDAAHTYYLASGRYRSAQILGNSLLIMGLLSLILIPLFPYVLELATRSDDNSLAPYLGIAALMIPVVGVRYLLLSVFMARRRIDMFNYIYMAGNLLLAVMLAAGFLYFQATAVWGLWAFIISQLVMVIAAASWVWVTERRLAVVESSGRFRLGFSFPLLRHSLSYGLRGFLGTILTTFIYRFDTILVLRWLGNAAQGHYWVAVFLAEKLTHLTASVQAVLFPHIAQASPDEANALTPRVCRNTLLWVCLAALVLYALSAPFILIFYSSAFEASIAPMRILLPGIAALTITKLLSADLSGRNKRFLPTLFMLLTLTLNLGLNWLWTRPHGIVGAAWASTIAYGTQALLMLFYFYRVTGIAPLAILLPQRDDWDAYRRLFARIGRRGGRDQNDR